MGFIKREEFDALLLRVSKLESELAKSDVKKKAKKTMKKAVSTKKKKD
jgi:BMFP domain-containing protein YqiC